MLTKTPQKSIDVKVPKPKIGKKASELDFLDLKIMLYGPSSAGKTRSVAELLEAGLKILYFSTDIGGSGLFSVFNYLRQNDKKHLLDNLIVIESKYLMDYDKVISFISDPTKFIDDFYDLGIDLIFWDGFSNFQSDFIHRKVQDNNTSAAMEKDKTLSEAREAGMQFEIQDYGQIKLATTKAINKFFAINNKKTGQIIHKIVVCHPTYATKSTANAGGIGQSALVEVKKPQITGQAAASIFAAFDLIIYCGFKKESKGYTYYYQTAMDDSTVAKNRGFEFLQPIEEASMLKLWNKLTDGTGYTTKAFDQSLIEKED